MTWKIAYKSSPSTPAEEIVVDVTTPWEAVETARSQEEGDPVGKVIYVKAGE